MVSSVMAAVTSPDDLGARAHHAIHRRLAHAAAAGHRP